METSGVVMLKQSWRSVTSTRSRVRWNAPDLATAAIFGSFFEEAIPARLARNLGSFLLTEAMELRPEIGLKSYDRLFPNQDTLPKGGFGNLIALPLQKQPRLREIACLLMSEFTPYPDQWAFLSSIKRMTKAQCEALVREAQSKGGSSESGQSWRLRQRTTSLGPPLPPAS